MPRTRNARATGPDLVGQLSAQVSQLIRENRRLKRQLDTLTNRMTPSGGGAVDRRLSTIQKRLQVALGNHPRPRQPTNGRRKRAPKGREA